MHTILINAMKIAETMEKKMSTKNVTPVKATIEDINRLAELINDNWSLCQLFEGKRWACEAETMVAQTILAAKINSKKEGEPFSWRGGGVLSSGGNGLVDNGTAYGMLTSEEYFVEEERTNKEGSKQVVIFPTKRLVTLLDHHFLGKN